MPESCSQETDRLLAPPRSNLLQVKRLLSAQSDEGAERLRNAQVAFLMTKPAQSSSTSGSRVHPFL